MKRAFTITSPFYLCSLIIGFIVTYASPGSSQAFVDFAQRGTIAGALITPFLENKNLLIIGLTIFLINFLLGAFLRFVLIPILLYHTAFILGISMGFLAGFVIGCPTSLSYLSDFPSFGTILYILTIIFENLGYITACTIGYEIAKKSQEGLTTKDFLKSLIVPIHLKDAKRRNTIRKGLHDNIRWILISMIFIAVGTIVETLLIVYFR